MKSNQSEGRITKITYIGGPTALIEMGSLRLLTDPTFDPAGTDYKLTKKLVGPALSAGEIGRVDVILLSRDQHVDNMDEAGRLLAKEAGQVVTTPAGTRRLGGNAVGLQSWQKHSVRDREGNVTDIIATTGTENQREAESIAAAARARVLRQAVSSKNPSLRVNRTVSLRHEGPLPPCANFSRHLMIGSPLPKKNRSAPSSFVRKAILSHGPWTNLRLDEIDESHIEAFKIWALKLAGLAGATERQRP